MNPSSLTDTLSSLNLNISMATVLFFVKVVLVVLAVNMGLYAFNFLRKVFFPNRNAFETPTTLHRFSHFLVNCVKLALVAGLIYININPVTAGIIALIALCTLQIIIDPMINAWHDNHNREHGH